MELQHNNNTTEKILTAIESKQVKPRPKWHFIVRNIVLWIPGLITTFLGAYTVAGVLYGILHAHLENRLYADYSGQVVFIVIIPILWVLSFALFCLITISLLRKTNTGYRHTAVQLLSISVASSIIIGILFYTFTSASLAGPGMLYRYPTQHQQESIWNNPDNGRISGVITTVNGANITVADFNGSIWHIDASAIPANDKRIVQQRNAIRVVGVETADHIFTACRVLEWELFPIQQAAASMPFTLHKQPISCDILLAHYHQ
jgi:hypothetical protein